MKPISNLAIVLCLCAGLLPGQAKPPKLDLAFELLGERVRTAEPTRVSRDDGVLQSPLDGVEPGTEIATEEHLRHVLLPDERKEAGVLAPELLGHDQHEREGERRDDRQEQYSRPEAEEVSMRGHVTRIGSNVEYLSHERASGLQFHDAAAPRGRHL